ncbi:hypothetical protein PFWH6_0187 [Pseudomonas fluorescens WH6]|nr:hypothetical protein PFWH6_0187 [Pseudomonas fluorescens WH6]
MRGVRKAHREVSLKRWVPAHRAGCQSQSKAGARSAKNPGQAFFRALRWVSGDGRYRRPMRRAMSARTRPRRDAETLRLAV